MSSSTAAAADVSTEMRDVAQKCMTEWSTKPSDLCHNVIFKGVFTEGKRKYGVSKELFDHMYQTLSNMQCWDPREVALPWKHHIVYEIQPDALEKDDVRTLQSQSHVHHVQTTLKCDAKGNEAALLVSYQDTPSLKLGIGPHVTVHVNIEKQLASKHYIKKDASFTKIIVESSKTFTFKEHFEWTYTFILRYREPYYKNEDLKSQDAIDKDMVFCDPPVCAFELSCSGINTLTDHGYFADSFLCKITDLLPRPWKMIPLHVKRS